MSGSSRHNVQKTSARKIKSNPLVASLYHRFPQRNPKNEKIRRIIRLYRFDIRNSIAYTTISLFFGHIKFAILREIAWICATELFISLDRDAQRSIQVCYKWLDENWNDISQSGILNTISVEEGKVVRKNKEMDFLPDFDPLKLVFSRDDDDDDYIEPMV